MGKQAQRPAKHILLLGLILFLALFEFAGFTPVASATDVMLQDPVYLFLERMELKGAMVEMLSVARPYSRRQVASYLAKVIRSDAQLTGVERQQLEYFSFQYKEELAELGLSEEEEYKTLWTSLRSHQPFKLGTLLTNGRDHYNYQYDDWTIYLNGHLTGWYHSKDYGQLGPGSEQAQGYGLSMRLTWDRLSVYSAAFDNQVEGKPEYIDSIRFPYRKFGSLGKNNFDFFETNTQIAYEMKHLSFMAGKTKNHWTYGRSGVLMLSNTPLPYTQLRTKAEFGPFEMTSVLAKLVQYPYSITSTDTLPYGSIRQQYADKYMAAHRFQINFFNVVQIGLNEMLIYGERGFDVDYIHPLIFLRGAEHYTGDRDNVMVGYDVRLRLPYRSTFYGAIVIDDLRVFGEQSYYANKNGLQFSFMTVDPLYLKNTTMWVEYVKLTPFLYSHKFPVDVARHYNVNLGYPLEPNSDIISAKLIHQPLRAVSFAGEYSLIRHGANTADLNVGGDVLVPSNDGAAPDVSFLSGDKTTTNRLEFSVEAELFYGCHIGFAVANSWLKLDPVEGTSETWQNKEWRVDFVFYPTMH